MDRNDLERAAAANAELKTAERHLDALLSGDFKVVGVTIGRAGLADGGSLGPIQLEKGRGGTGSISSIGFPDGLGDAMTRALYDHFRERVTAAKAVLQTLGVSVAA